MPPVRGINSRQMLDKIATLTRSFGLYLLKNGNQIVISLCYTKESSIVSFQIPIVPKIAPRPEPDPNQNNCLSPPPPHNVPPEQINNFVYASPQDRLVMDFGEIKLDDHQRPLFVASGSSAATLPPRPLSQQSSSASMSSSASTSGLLKRVRRTIAPTLNRARRKSASSSADNAR